MATMHQISLTNNLQWITSKPLLKQTPPKNSIFICSTSSLPNNRLSSFSANATRVTSSFDYNNTGVYNNNNEHYEYEKGLIGTNQQYPRPEEIQWKKELCNSVQLIGTVGTSVEFKQLGSGKVLAWCRLAVRKSATDTTWISLTFWDEMAHIASQHVEKGQQIYVTGRLVSDTVDSDDGKQQTYYKVVVQELKFVERSPPPAASNDGDFNYNYNANSSSMTTGNYFYKKNKRSPNYPDFKHKDTGEALWVEGRFNPSWVKSQLSVLDSRMESNANTRSDSMFGDHLTPY
ncbi:hypothetical protein M8C21_003726 [Ambrosia artemisiifolia]|uniref:Primosome PriB/single-strand DNA-binding protein n=1 Tax=Ambrosia artemisiifolia TaxID=4212 RepID=A0AAD5D5E1_AMBAR|nr:hypothetical protein M8C21_003726 [Ambrosia artemisiifolia]